MTKKNASASSGIKLVIVESPTKAKTIRKFLGKDFIVESCMGHVRDLPQSAKDIPAKFKKESWATLGVNVEKDFEPIYCVPKDKLKVVKNLRDKLAEADELYLATDEDREGESISWHLAELLNPKIPMKRMIFHEITREAIQKSLQATRQIDSNLVKAQEARRILDRLVGYSISPLLWKKVAYGLSAGRVQSVAVKLIASRELDRIRFKKAGYFSLTAHLGQGAESFEAKLLEWQGKKVATGADFDGTTGQLKAQNRAVHILQQREAATLQSQLAGKSLTVTEVEEKPIHRRPFAPFITSTLQQEANRKLGMSSRETMQVAQKLYEQGMITYMRTDSTFLSQEAIQAARNCITRKYGKEYLPEKPRVFDAKKVKGAQEAHEAIRPAGTDFMDPEDSGLIGAQFKLYELIWKRTVACQMTDARQKQVSARLSGPEQTLFSASGMTIEFPGFLRAYVEGSDDPEAELADREVRLPKLVAAQQWNTTKVTPAEHETKPPARYTEASLVQTMEKEGIGRPSTYASIIGTIIDRGYVRRQGQALVPTFTAMVVSKLLEQHLTQFVDLGFTSQMERSLDDIAEGDLDPNKYLNKIYFGTQGLKEMISREEKNIDPAEARQLVLPGLDRFSFRVGKFGAYVCVQRDEAEVCASIPDSESPADMTADVAEKLIEQKINGADSLGKDPATGLPVYALTGRYGPYVQLGEVGDEEAKPKRASLPAGLALEDVTLEKALSLLALPKVLGNHPALGKEVKVGLGRFGPFVVCDGDFRSIPKGEDLFTMTLARALELLSQPKKGRGARAAPLRVVGEHPEDKAPIDVMNGPYGPYLKWGKINASLPEGVTVDAVTLAQAVDILRVRAETHSPKKKKTASRGKAKVEKTAGPANATRTVTRKRA